MSFVDCQPGGLAIGGYRNNLGKMHVCGRLK